MTIEFCFCFFGGGRRLRLRGKSPLLASFFLLFRSSLFLRLVFFLSLEKKLDDEFLFVCLFVVCDF